MFQEMYNKNSPVSHCTTPKSPLLRCSTPKSPHSPLLKHHSEKLIYDIHSTETSANYIVDADILASQSRYLFCSFCQRVLQTKSGLTNHEKSHIREQIKLKRLERYKKNKKPRVYTCKECGDVFSQRGLLNKHVKTHNNIIRCSFCHKTFEDRMEFELHDAISDGKNYESLNFPTYRTRSQSRLSCHSVRATSTPFETYFRPRSLSETSKRSSRSVSRISMSSEILPVQDWIENNFCDTASEAVSSAWSEADFSQDRFICSENNCMKTFPSLNWVTSHEIREHKKLALFRCRECRKRFTTSLNLQQHRLNSHSDVLICVLCEHPQRGMAAIQEHFHLHQKYSVKCDVCSKMFLSKYYLDEHLKYKMHLHKNYKQSKGAILIRVDRRETQRVLDIEEDSLPIKLKRYSAENCEFLGDSSRMDYLPWRT